MSLQKWGQSCGLARGSTLSWRGGSYKQVNGVEFLFNEDRTPLLSLSTQWLENRRGTYDGKELELVTRCGMEG